MIIGPFDTKLGRRFLPISATSRPLNLADALRVRL
jgi:hypothetical protein